MRTHEVQIYYGDVSDLRRQIVNELDDLIMKTSSLRAAALSEGSSVLRSDARHLAEIAVAVASLVGELAALDSWAPVIDQEP